ncbi:MAG: type II toxin-antitoxin system HicB family antitoxin [Coprothermobacterota bacterium]|nr:type II toxin-antitoxin system HicB family antitoxin [Coprothermobacterota bacterium]
MRIEIEKEDDGRWIADVGDIPGAMVYGMTRQEALAKAKALALRIIADRIDHGEFIPELDELFGSFSNRAGKAVCE